MSETTTETLPTAGGTYLQHADGRLERVDDAQATAAADAELSAAPTPSQKTRAAKSATPE